MAQTTEVRAEAFDESGCEPMLLFWYVDVGAEVSEGQDLCEIETAKAVFVVTAPATGVLRRVDVREGDAVASEQLLGIIEAAT